MINEFSSFFDSNSVMVNELSYFFESNNVEINEQCGFRTEVSTNIAMANFIKQVFDGSNDR